MSLWLLLVVLVQFQLTLVMAFQPSSPLPPASHNDIQVSTVKTSEDILSLADLRYQEWMSDEPNPPKLSSFRLATAEIFHERRQEGSTVSLATMLNTDDVKVIIGAAELSPIELQGVFISSEDGKSIDVEDMPLYITDVVTSSAYRRLGIGSILMNAVERTALVRGSQCVFLHVENDNIGARKFYKRLGYTDVDVKTEGTNIQDGELLTSPKTKSFDKKAVITMDFDRLAANASTVGQILMMKKMSAPTPQEGSFTINNHPQSDSSVTLGEGGFGKQKTIKKKKKKKRKG